MSFPVFRRAALVAALASSALIAGCGSGSVFSSLIPTRIAVFGDGMSDVGQLAGARYTINDATNYVWPQRVAISYGLTLTAKSAGGLGYAQGNARIMLKPDAAGIAATPTVQEQMNAFLASNTIGASDVVMIGGGHSDIIVQMQAFLAGSQTEAQMLANVAQAAKDLATLTRQLVAAGGTHVVLTGVYNMGKSPWATSIGQDTLLSTASTKFNEALLTAVVDLGNNVLFADAAFTFNLVVNQPASYSITNTTDPICTTLDAGNGLGIGAGKINSATCTSSTLVAGATAVSYAFADPVYFAPNAHEQFGLAAYTRMKSRW
jgi:outer membrane lipase/esterase